jgi:hypothetical protein
VRGVEETEQVHLDHLAPLAGVGIGDRTEQHHARVVHEDVEAAELVVGRLHETACLLLVGDVDLPDQHRPVEALRDRLQPLGTASTERDARAGGRQGPRSGLSDSRRGAGHGSHAAFERSWH